MLVKIHPKIIPALHAFQKIVIGSWFITTPDYAQSGILDFRTPRLHPNVPKGDSGHAKLPLYHVSMVEIAMGLVPFHLSACPPSLYDISGYRIHCIFYKTHIQSIVSLVYFQVWLNSDITMFTERIHSHSLLTIIVLQTKNISINLFELRTWKSLLRSILHGSLQFHPLLQTQQVHQLRL